MAEYQVLARKYRPQSFCEVIGQEAIVVTLKNAINQNRLAHAYLFCGSRGTGKTTLARVFAKALNCQTPTVDHEPCNQCSTCKEITHGNSLDVLEIDGASHRGIDDIRQINETAGYASSSGKYKIYIIDEVHMLTKEAFNALLKTLEEPPPKVKFFFATTEPHKVLPTILSRCQRFNLNRISLEKIVAKLQSIAQDLNVTATEEALRIIAQRADGGLRDAESLFDQILAFHSNALTAEDVSAALGLMPRNVLFELDKAGKEGNLAIAFEIAHQVFTQGKDFVHFVETLIEHYRHLLLIKLSGKNAPFLMLSENDRDRYEASARLYSQEQCLFILDFLIEAQNQIRFSPSSKIALENILLRILRSHARIPIDFLVRRLTELEQVISGSSLATASSTAATPLAKPPLAETLPPQPQQPQPIPQPPLLPPQPPQPQPPLPQPQPPAPQPPLPEPMPPQPQTPPLPPVVSQPKTGSSSPQKKTAAYSPSLPQNSISVDPTPTPADLGRKAPSPTFEKSSAKHHRFDTLVQFASIELEGTLEKKQGLKH